ncbi:MAG: PilZ domain-containing protein [Oscillospiraceae bacterium]|nr:PilZ domain-containing protein [Oscillospiraceae bacterium]
MEKLYLILDSDGSPVEQGVLESPPGMEILQFRLLKDEDDAPDISKLGEVQLVGLDDQSQSMRGEIVRQRGNRLAVRPTAKLGKEARENLRIMTNFESVMYPVTGFWKGQRIIRGHDLSCGGLAFYTPQALKDREVVEAVLPVTDQPLVVKMRILRQLPSDNVMPLYASRFVDLCMDEEVFIRKAVFSIQVSRGA